MLYVFFGTDAVQTRDNARAKARALSRGTEPSVISVENYYAGILAEYAGSTSLFGGPAITLIDMLSEHTDAFAALKEDMPLLAASAHTFIVIESALLAADKKQFQKHAEVCEECVLEKAEAFNTFALADALLDRDKKKLWLLLLAARRAGVPEENTIGTLMWQMKALRLAVRTKSAEGAGLKAFPYTKAKRALTHWKGDDIDRASRELLVLYHDGHLGKRDIALALEEWILSI